MMNCSAAGSRPCGIQPVTTGCSVTIVLVCRCEVSYRNVPAAAVE